MTSVRVSTLPVVMLLFFAFASLTWAQQRYVIVDQDGVGPGGSDIQSILLLLQEPSVSVLGITVVSGDVWADEGVRHITRALEIVHRTEIPVYQGAAVPLVRTAAETGLQQSLYGKAWYEGAFRKAQGSAVTLQEGEPHAAAAQRSAIAFLIETVHRYPHQVTIFAGGPMTNIALAIRTDPQFASLARELIFMGGSLNPKTTDPEFSFHPRHEFNFWFDPEAAHIALTAPWASLTATTVDISLQAQLTAAGKAAFAACTALPAKYMQHYGSGSPYLWDELAVVSWMDPSVIATADVMYMDVSLDHGYTYGDTITWSEQSRPSSVPLQPVHVQQQLAYPRFEAAYLRRMCGATKQIH